MTDERRSQMLGAGVGDTVYCVTSAQYKEVCTESEREREREEEGVRCLTPDGTFWQFLTFGHF